MLAPNPFRNEDYIKKVKCPLLLIHGEKDDLIPWDHSQVTSLNSLSDFAQTLFDISESEVKMIQICHKADHNRVSQVLYNADSSVG